MKTASPVLQLRAGRYTAGDVARSADGEASLGLLPGWGGDNAWGLDAVLAVADDLPDPDGGDENPLLIAFQAGLRKTPGDGNVTPLVAELLAAVAADVFVPDTAPSPPGITVILVKARRYYASRSNGPIAYLLRGSTLVPLTPGEHSAGIPARDFLFALQTEELQPDGPDHESPTPDVASGRLEDGDALLICDPDLFWSVGDEEIHRVLTHSLSPGAAAAHLADVARNRGCRFAGVSILFVGKGPQPDAVPLPMPGVSDPAAPVHLGRPAPAPAPVSPDGRRASAFVVAAALAGALLGVGLGYTLLTAVSQAGTRQPAREPGVSGLPAPLPSGGNMSGAPGPGPAAPVSGVAAPAGPRGQANWVPRPAASVPASGAPAPSPARRPPPPPHALASGMSNRVELTLSLDSRRGELAFRSNQGALMTTAAWVPAGERLVIPAILPQRLDSATELRLLPDAAQPPAALRGDSLQRLLRGESVRVPNIYPGDYRVTWWNPAPAPAEAPFLVLRVAGL